jgi:ATP-dependent RNA helicase DDX24/MAK5
LYLLYAAKDFPLFPISSSLLKAVKQRVCLARELDQLELATRRSNSETAWFQKALTEMDMLLDDSDLYPLSSVFDLDTVSDLSPLNALHTKIMVKNGTPFVWCTSSKVQ